MKSIIELVYNYQSFIFYHSSLIILVAPLSQMFKINPKTLTHFIARQLAMFSQTQSTTKSYRMPVRQVQKKFKPKKLVQFHEGRALIYLNKQGLLTPTLLTAHLTVPMIYLGYLIKNNPWYLTFPAALPIMGFIQVFLFMRLITHKKDNKYQIERIYLVENGQMLEVWLANKIRRKLKNTQDELYMLVKDLKTPPVGDNELPLKGTLFPEKFNAIRWPMPWEYGWYKYDFNRENYIIPKRFEYANWQLLIPCLKGIQIDTSDCPKTPIPVDELKKMPTLQDALKQAEEKKKYDHEWEKQNGPLRYSQEEDV